MRRKQYNVLKWLVLRPVDWSAILGVNVVDAEGWRGVEEKSFEDPVNLKDFVGRCWLSAVTLEDGATDLYDVENYLAEDSIA